jgi:hypothetical protein
VTSTVDDDDEEEEDDDDDADIHVLDFRDGIVVAFGLRRNVAETFFFFFFFIFTTPIYMSNVSWTDSTYTRHGSVTTGNFHPDDSYKSAGISREPWRSSTVNRRCSINGCTRSSALSADIHQQRRCCGQVAGHHVMHTHSSPIPA